MSATIDDLRETLAANVRDLPPSAARTVAVRRRVRRLGRQRAAAGVLAVALVAGVAGLGVHAGQEGSGQSGSATAPEYANGGRLAVSADIDTRSATSAQASFVATSDTLVVTQRSCTAAPARKLLVEILVNGASVGSSSCQAAGDTAITVQPGIVAGQRVTVTARLDTAVRTPVLEAQRLSMPRTTVRVAFYQSVSRAEYRFPPTPAKLAAFPPATSHGSEDLAMGLTDGASETRVDVTRGLDLELTSRAPGVVTVDLDGHRIGMAQSWDYSITTSAIRMTPAQLAAIGVTPETTATGARLVATGSDFRAPPTVVAWQVAVLSP